MALLAGVLRLGFIFLLPGKVPFNISGEKGEENADHEGVVNDADPGKCLRDKVERIDQVQKTQKAAHESASGELAVTTGEEIAEHGGAGTNQAGEVGQLGAGAEGIHGCLVKIKIKMKMKGRGESAEAGRREAGGAFRIGDWGLEIADGADEAYRLGI